MFTAASSCDAHRLASNQQAPNPSTRCSLTFGIALQRDWAAMGTAHVQYIRPQQYLPKVTDPTAMRVFPLIKPTVQSFRNGSHIVVTGCRRGMPPIPSDIPSANYGDVLPHINAQQKGALSA